MNSTGRRLRPAGAGSAAGRHAGRRLAAADAGSLGVRRPARPAVPGRRGSGAGVPLSRRRPARLDGRFGGARGGGSAVGHRLGSRRVASTASGPPPRRRPPRRRRRRRRTGSRPASRQSTVVGRGRPVARLGGLRVAAPGSARRAAWTAYGCGAVCRYRRSRRPALCRSRSPPVGSWSSMSDVLQFWPPRARFTQPRRDASRCPATGTRQRDGRPKSASPAYAGWTPTRASRWSAPRRVREERIDDLALRGERALAPAGSPVGAPAAPARPRRAGRKGHHRVVRRV